MSLQQGIALGLDISRGARQESRSSAQHDQYMRERKEAAEYNARMRPLEEKRAQLGLQDLESLVAHNKQTRPLTLQEMQEQAAHAKTLRPIEAESAQLGLESLKESNAHASKLRPYDLEQAQLNVKQSKQSLAGTAEQQQWQRDDRKKNQVTSERATRLARVQQMAPVEYARFERTGRFSDAFLRDSADTPLSPFNALDADHVNALDEARKYLDPRNEQANPYADGRIFQVASTLLKKELNNGGVNPKTGLPIVSKQIVSVMPATTRDGKPLQGQLFVEVEVTDEGGNTYRAPVTTNRSSDADDALQTMDFGNFVGRVNAENMFVNAVKSQPEGMKWLQEKAASLNSGTGNQKLKSDETMWGGRPQKTDTIYKRFSENPAFGSAEEGTQFVSYGDYEWTEGKPEKVKFLESVARENKQVFQNYRQMLKDEPDEAQAYLQQNFIHEPAVVFEMQQSKQKGATAKDPNSRENQVLQGIVGAEQAKPEAEPDPIETLTSQPKWWLTEDKIPTAAFKKLTPEQVKERYEFNVKQRNAKETEKAAATEAAKAFLQNGQYEGLSRDDKRKWFIDNARYLSLEERKSLNGNQ